MTGSLLDFPLMSVSIFNALVMFWLGLTVLLNAARRSWGTWLVAIGLQGGAVFFISHSAILGLGRKFFSQEISLWWRLGWPPLIFLPLAWYFASLWFGGFPEHRGYRDRHFKWAAGVSFLSFALFAGLFIPDLVPSFSQLALLDLASPFSVAGIPLIMIIFPVYIIACTALSIAALFDRRAGAGSLNAGARDRAFPWLVAGSLTLLLVSLIVSATLFWVVQGFQPGGDFAGFERTIAWMDLTVSVLISLTAVFVGQAVVAYEVFSGTVLPRGGLRRGWRRILFLAAGYALLVGVASYFPLDPVYTLLLTGLIMTGFFALLLWRSFRERSAFFQQIRPFLSSQGLYSQMLDPREGSFSPQAELEALAGGILGAGRALLLPGGAYASLVSAAAYPSGARVGQDFPTHRLSAENPFLQFVPESPANALWGVGLWPGERSGGTLILGPKQDGSLYMQEELELAQTAAERILDSAAGAELSRRLALLQRERIVATRLADQQTRRILHDNILPQLHTSLLSLPKGHPAGDTIAGIHRQVSDLLLKMPPATFPSFVDQGLPAALKSLVENELAGQFDQVDFDLSPEAEIQAARLPGLLAEVIFYAAREALRNAALHGRGEGPLQVAIRARCSSAGELSISVIDDGVGFGGANPAADLPKSGQGLLLHSALVAVIGGQLTIDPRPEGGSAVHISLPVPDPLVQ